MSDSTPPLPPAAGSILPQWAVVTLTILVAVAGVVMVIPTLPPAVHAVAGAVVAIGAAFGIASPGIRRAIGQPPAPATTLEQAAAELRKGPPAP